MKNNLIICTLNWNGADKIEKLKNSLLPCLQDLSWKWFIKDNGSKDNSVELIKSWNNPNIILKEFDHNRHSFAEGMNVLYSESSPNDNDYILLLNNDIIFQDEISIKNMINILNKSEVGLVGARLLYPDNTLQHAGVVFEPHRKLPMHFRVKEKSNNNDKKNRYFQAVTGAVWLTKSEYYKNISTDNKSGINGLPEKMIWMFEDIWASLSIRYDMDKKVVYCGSTNITHEESASLKKNPVNKLFMNYNIETFLKKWNDRYIVDKDLYCKDNNYNICKEY